MDKIKNLWEAGEPDFQQRINCANKVLAQFTRFWSANFLYSDDEYLYAFANKRKQCGGRSEPPGMHYLYRDYECEHDAQTLSGVEIQTLKPPEAQSVFCLPVFCYQRKIGKLLSLTS